MFLTFIKELLWQMKLESITYLDENMNHISIYLEFIILLEYVKIIIPLFMLMI